MLNDLNPLIKFDIELKISGSTIYSKNLLPNYFIILQLDINSTLSLMITRLVNQCFFGGNSYFFFHITFKYL